MLIILCMTHVIYLLFIAFNDSIMPGVKCKENVNFLTLNVILKMK